MNFIERTILSLANYKTVYGICKEIEDVCEDAKSIFLPSVRKDFIDNFIDEVLVKYNQKNKVKIPEELVDSLYEMAVMASNKEKTGDIKRYFVKVVVSQLTDLTLKFIEYLITKAVLKI